MVKRVRHAVISIIIVPFTISAQLNMTGLGNYQGHKDLNPQGTYYSAVWGYYDENGREYGFLGCYNGTAIVDLSYLPDSLHEVSFIPGPRTNNSYREMKTYLNYLYIVSDSPQDPGVGLQIVDLSYLPDSAHYVGNYTYATYNRSHTISESNGYLFLNGGNSTVGGRVAGGTAILSLNDPLQPVKLAYVDSLYVHDSHMRNDTLIVCHINQPTGSGFSIVDIKNKLAPIRLTTKSYTNATTHNVWTTDDGKFALTTDEVVAPQTLKIWNIQNVNSILMVAEWNPRPTEVVHNVCVKGNYAYCAYYTAGVLVADISYPTNPTEAGYYDTYSATTGGYNGVWGIYPYLPSGRILASDRQTGLHVLSFSQQKIGKIVGTIKDSSSGLALKGAIIRIKETGQTRWTGSNGKYIWGYAVGTFTAIVQKPGFVSREVQFVVRENMTDTVNVSLTAIPTTVDLHLFQPTDYRLYQNYPNPFNPRTTIRFDLPKQMHLTLKVYNVFGQEVRTIANGIFGPGFHQVSFDGSAVTSGVYFYTFRTPEFASTLKMMLLK